MLSQRTTGILTSYLKGHGVRRKVATGNLVRRACGQVQVQLDARFSSHYILVGMSGVFRMGPGAF